MADASLAFDIIGRDKSGARALRDVGNEADRTKRKLRDVGDGADHSSRAVGNLAKLTAALGAASTEALGAAASAAAKNPYVLAAAAGVAAMATIPATAAVAGAALAGLGGGFVALGAVGVRESEQVKGAVASLSATTKSELKSAASVLEDDFVGALGRMQGTVKSTGPALSRMFRSVEPSIAALADGVDGFVQNTMPGLERAVEASEPVLDMLASKLPEVGAAVGDAFGRIGEQGPGAMKALAASVDVLNIAIEQSGKIVAGGAAIFDWVSKIPGNDRILGAIAGLAGVDKGQRSAASSAATLTAHERTLSEALKSATTQTLSLAEASGFLDNAAMSAAQAEISARDAAASLGEALKTSKGSMDLNTEAGRRAQSMLIAGAEAAAAAGDKQFEQSLSVDKATSAYNRHIGALRQQMLNAGMSKAQVDGLIGSFVASYRPATTAAGAVAQLNTQIQALKNKQVQIAQSGAPDAAAKVKALQAEIDRLHGKVVSVTINRVTREWTEKKQASMASMKARGGAIGFAGGGFSGRVLGEGTATSDSIPAWLSNGEYVIRASSVRKLGLPLLDKLNAAGMAGGGSVTWGDVSEAKWEQLYAAGWRGRAGDNAERLYAPAPARPAAPVAVAPAGGSCKSHVVRLQVDISGGDDELARWFRKRVRIDGGGDVQVAFGR